VGPRAGLDRCGKSRPHRDSIPGPYIVSQNGIKTLYSLYPVVPNLRLRARTRFGARAVISFILWSSSSK
jgi:hypothetical protein